ncbi:hypothetical protein PMW_43 [Pseudomonas phage phiPMW]|uniref:Uncharacterized protein n=1 Tax=Pseudomonas phage phiPMW TaxID=1815582 RepID=A0A1S5R1A9_9CAUD|nr:hypothetical protein FDG97_gp043 [Pseudomonas phage phiPMW]ANA49168.1 hypothetical protein PMW_43 [Pseudomonas phage phiPMW]
MLTKEMKSFLSDWLTWVNIGAPIHDVFEQNGLCSNFDRWSSKQGLDLTTFANGIKSMKLVFINEGLDREFPFDGHAGNYLEALKSASFTKNQMRVDWVRNHL